MEMFGQEIEANMTKKNSLVGNIQKRQKAGTSRPKSKSTVNPPNSLVMRNLSKRKRVKQTKTRKSLRVEVGM